MRRFLAILSWLLVLPAFGLAQSETATFSGRVTDQTGAVVKDAQVILRNTDTGVEFPSKTNDSGLFVYPGMEPGKYQLTVRAKGFSEVIDEGIVLHVQDRVEQNITLKIGSASERVVVNANSIMLNTQDASVGQVVDQGFIENIPLNGRTMQGLIELSPGVVLNSMNTSHTSGQFVVDGQRAEDSTFTVDGVSANTGVNLPGSGNTLSGNLPALTASGTTQALASLDDIQEFKVQTSSFSAEYGTRPGGQIAIVTRSGSNQYHGTLFDYLRNTVFDANDWFANQTGQPQPPEHQNDFGGTFGGPVRIPGIYNGKDKTFFFFNYEGLRLILPNFSQINVPDLCLRGTAPATGPTSCAAISAADANAPGAACGSSPTGTNSAGLTVGQMVTPGTAGIMPLLKAFPLPNQSENLCGPGLANFAYSYGNGNNIDSLSVRIDHNLTSKITLFGRYSQSPSDSFTIGGVAGDPATTEFASFGNRTVTFGSTWLVSPKMNNDVRFNYTVTSGRVTQALTSLGGATPPAQSAVLPSVASTGSEALYNFLLPGDNSIAAFEDQNAYTNAQHQFQIVDGFSYLRGPHQFKFGADFRRLTPVNSIATYTLSNQFTTLLQVEGVCPVGSAPSCTPGVSYGGGTVTAGEARHPEFQNLGLYAEDTWKVTHRLTANLGLRWEVDPAPATLDGRYPLAVNPGFVFPNFSSLSLAPTGSPLWQTTYKNFAPRVGFAYQLRQRPGSETVIRGGYGIFYDTGNNVAGAGFGFPYSASSPFPVASLPLFYPFQASQVTPPTVPVALVNGVIPITAGAVFVFQPNLQLPYTEQWNFAVQQALGKSQSLTLTYVGNRGLRLLEGSNQSIHTVNPNFGAVEFSYNGAYSNYDALQAQFQRRLSHGLEALVGYTWAHALDLDSNSNSPNDIVRYGNSTFDIRQTLSAAITYAVPTLGHTGWEHAILGGWSTDYIFQARSAPPLDLVGGFLTNPVTAQMVEERPSVVPGIPWYVSGAQCTANLKANNASNPTYVAPAIPGGKCLNNLKNDITPAQAAQYGCRLNSNGTAFSAEGPFCTQATGTTGNLGRNQVRAFGAWQLDTALQRVFPIHERLSLLFRAEAFNVFNHPNFGPPNASIGGSNFGLPTSMLGASEGGGLATLYQFGGPRSLQFALKLRF